MVEMFTHIALCGVGGLVIGLLMEYVGAGMWTVVWVSTVYATLVWLIYHRRETGHWCKR